MRKITFILLLSLVSLVGKAALPYDWTTFFATGATGSGVLETGVSAVLSTWYNGTVTGGANPTLVTPSDLSFIDGNSVNYIDNSAGKAIYINSPLTVRNSIFYLTSTGYTTGTYYVSFLLNVATGTAPASTTLLMNFNQSSTGSSSYGRIYIKQSTGNTGFVLTTNSYNGTVSSASSELSYGSTHLIILKFVMAATPSVQAFLFIDPTLGGSEGTPTLTADAYTTTALTVKGLVVQSIPSFNGKIAGLRLSSTWADAIKCKLSKPTVATGATSVTSGGCRANWTAVSNIASVSSYTVTVYNENGSTNQTITGISNSTTYTDIIGLSASSNYTYKVTAVGNGTSILNSDQSDAISFNTSASSNPTLSVDAISGSFGNQVINTTSGPNSFTITGTLLTSADVTVGSLNGYSYSTTSNGTYTSTLTIPQSGGSFSQAIYVKFTPTAAQSYNGNISIGGGGATSVNCAVTGAGIYGEPTSQASSVSFSNLIAAGTGFTINWSAGDGTNHIVLIKSASAVDANPVDANTYTANTIFGSGSLIGTGNYVVFNGAGTSVAVTGLTKGTTYYVKVYTYNNGGGSENYLTSSSASGSQLAQATITSNGTGGGNWATGASWVGGLAPGQYDNVVIAGTDVINVAATAKCNNLTINSGGKVWATAAQTLQIFGTSLVCDGSFGDASTANSLLTLQFGGNLVISGSSKIYPYKIQPITGLSNIGITFNNNAEVTYTSTAILSDNTGNDNITFTVLSGKTLTVDGNWSMTSSTGTNGTANTTININSGGTITLLKALATPMASGKTCIINIDGTLNGGTSCTQYSYAGGSAPNNAGGSNTINVNGSFSTTNLNVSPAVTAGNATYGGTIGVTPTFIVGSNGTLTVNGNADFSNTSVVGSISGTGTFKLGSGGTITIAAASGLDRTTGPIRTSTVDFNTAANYSFVGSLAQLTGSDLPATVNNLTINNVAGVTLGKNLLVNGTLNLTAGTLTNGSYSITLGNTGTINSTSGTMTSTPALGSTVNLTYNGATPISLPSDFPGSTTVSTLTVNNTAGLTLNANLTNVTNLTIGTNGILNVNPGKQLTVGTALTNNGTLNLLSNSSGTATYLDGASTSGTGTATVQQYITSGRNWYMTTPIASATGANLLTNAGSVVCYNEATGVWDPVVSGTALDPMRGYISASTVTTGAVSYTGVLNSGEKYIDLTRTSTAAKPGFNLVGNPYPSFVNWESATKNNLETTMWYRSRNAGNSAYIFDTYNATTHAGTGNNGTAVTTNIPPMQAFWVRVAAGNTTGRLTFNNTMRSHGSGTERMKAPKATEQQLLRLQVSNGTNSDEAIVVFNANASNNLDAYDSYKMSNNNSAVPEIYTLTANEELVINGFNTSSLQTEIPLGFRTGMLSTFSIKATEATNFNSDVRIILKDNVLNKQADLTDGSQYAFSSDVANTTDRFSIVFKSAGVTTDVENTNSNLTNLVFVNNNGQIVVQNTTGLLRSINIYNLIGQLVEKNTVLNSSATTTKMNTGVYFVHLQNENNIHTVCKVKVD